MPKFKIDPAPTFNEPVVFRMPGGKTGTINVTYRYMDQDAYKALFNGSKKSDVEFALDIATGWDAEEDFGEAALERLFKAYPTAGKAFFSTFRVAMFGAEEKN